MSNHIGADLLSYYYITFLIKVVLSDVQNSQAKNQALWVVQLMSYEEVPAAFPFYQLYVGIYRSPHTDE